VPNIKAQVHFLEVAMKREGDTDHAGVEKQKTDDAHVSDRSVFIDLEAWWNEWLDQLSIDRVIQHDEMTPFRRQENSPAVRIRCGVHWSESVQSGFSNALPYLILR
jgi:hypothetical protein